MITEVICWSDSEVKCEPSLHAVLLQAWTWLGAVIHFADWALVSSGFGFGTVLQQDVEWFRLRK